MRARVESLGGRLEAGHPPTGGFLVTVILPLNRPTPQTPQNGQRPDGAAYDGRRHDGRGDGGPAPDGPGYDGPAQNGPARDGLGRDGPAAPDAVDQRGGAVTPPERSDITGEHAPPEREPVENTDDRVTSEGER